MQVINTTNAPQAIGPYSQAFLHNGLLYLSGQIPLDKDTGLIVGDNIQEQTHQVIRNIDAVLKEVDVSFSSVIKTTCFLSDMADFTAFNEIYAAAFISKPARSCVAAKTLPKNALVEIEVIAVVDSN